MLCLTHRHSTSAPPLIASKATSVNGSARSYHISSTPGKWKSGFNRHFQSLTWRHKKAPAGGLLVSPNDVLLLRPTDAVLVRYHYVRIGVLGRDNAKR